MLVLEEWQLTPQRVAIHLPTATAVLADLHLGYHAARRRRGEAVPLPSLDELLAPLTEALERWSIGRVVVAGDLFEDGVDEALIAPLEDWNRRRRLEFFGVVPGNHDHRLTKDLPGIVVFREGFYLLEWAILHGDGRTPHTQSVRGHWHPSVRVEQCNHPCYLVRGRHLILPAFCREARGVTVNGNRRWRGHRCLVPVGDEVLDFGDQLTAIGPSPVLSPGARRRKG